MKVRFCSVSPDSPGPVSDYLTRRQIPFRFFARHSVSSTPEVGFVFRSSKPRIGQLEQLLHQCQVLLPVLRLYLVTPIPSCLP